MNLILTFIYNKKYTIVPYKIYSLTDSLIAEIANSTFAAGTQTVVRDATNMPAGYYFYNLQTGSSNITKKALVIK